MVPAAGGNLAGAGTIPAAQFRDRVLWLYLAAANLLASTRGQRASRLTTAALDGRFRVYLTPADSDPVSSGAVHGTISTKVIVNWTFAQSMGEEANG